VIIAALAANVVSLAAWQEASHVPGPRLSGAELEQWLSFAASTPVGPTMHKRAAQILAQQGDLDGAARVLRVAVHANPGDLMLAYQLGAVLGATGDRQGALEQWRRAGVTPQYLFGNRAAFEAYSGGRPQPDARELAAALWPDWSATWYAVGFSYFGGPETDLAIDAFSRAVALDAHWMSGGERLLAHAYLELLVKQAGKRDAK